MIFILLIRVHWCCKRWLKNYCVRTTCRFGYGLKLHCFQTSGSLIRRVVFFGICAQTSTVPTGFLYQHIKVCTFIFHVQFLTVLITNKYKYKNKNRIILYVYIWYELYHYIVFSPLNSLRETSCGEFPLILIINYYVPATIY
jgi:hypothetical protein